MSRQETLTNLRKILASKFSQGELETLCFDLGIDFDELPGETKSDKARELIEYIDNRDQISRLSIMIGSSAVSRPCLRTQPQLRLDCSPEVPWAPGRTTTRPLKMLRARWSMTARCSCRLVPFGAACSTRVSWAYSTTSSA